MLWLFALVMALLSVDLLNILLVQICLIVLRSLDLNEPRPTVRPTVAVGRLLAARPAVRLTA
jgi:hypothetical protein